VDLLCAHPHLDVAVLLLQLFNEGQLLLWRWGVFVAGLLEDAQMRHLVEFWQGLLMALQRQEIGLLLIIVGG
jgi:hypothetical protein